MFEDVKPTAPSEKEEVVVGMKKDPTASVNVCSVQMFLSSYLPLVEFTVLAFHAVLVSVVISHVMAESVEGIGVVEMYASPAFNSRQSLLLLLGVDGRGREEGRRTIRKPVHERQAGDIQPIRIDRRVCTARPGEKVRFRARERKEGKKRESENEMHC